jgi:hypothetical protein
MFFSIVHIVKFFPEFFPYRFRKMSLFEKQKGKWQMAKKHPTPPSPTTTLPKEFNFSYPSKKNL